MISPSDRELLRRYVDRDDRSFSELIARYERLVYSVCMRELGQSDLAADATQETFLLLARSAASLSRRYPGSLAGWLFAAARNAARNLRRAEKRRMHYEQGAGMQQMEAQEEQTRQCWESVEPGLNDALGQLRSSDREALLLRYYQQESLLQVGRLLGVSESAAQMRVARALERLRGVLKRRGIVFSAALLSLTLKSHVSLSVSAELSERLSEVAREGRMLTPVAAPAGQVSFSRLLVAGIVGVSLAGALATWQRLPLPERAQVDARELDALESMLGRTWKGTETGKRSNTTSLTATFHLSADRRRLTYRFAYAEGREPEAGWLTVERRTGRVVWEGRDVFSMRRDGETLSLDGWERRNTGSDVLWTRARQLWQRKGSRLLVLFERGDPPQRERSLNLLRS